MKNINSITSMPKQIEKILPVIDKFKSGLQNLYGSRFKQLILFGSYARGDVREFSDVDMLVILSDMESPVKEIDFMSDFTYSFLYDHNLNFSTIPALEERFRDWSTPLYINVKNEGIIL